MSLLVLSLVTTVGAVELTGTVTALRGSVAMVGYVQEGEMAPAIGDRVAFSEIIPETEISVESGTGMVKELGEGFVWVTVVTQNPRLQDTAMIEATGVVVAAQTIDYPDTLLSGLEKRILNGARTNDIKEINGGISGGGNVNALDETGAFPLAIAAVEGHLTVVALLLEAGANPNLESPKGGQTALKLAAAKGNNAVLTTLLDGGAAIDHRGGQYDNEFSGTTALFLAAARGHGKTVKLLLEHGADPYVENSRGATALHYAAQDGQLDAINAFFEAGVSLDYVSSTGVTPLMAATTTLGNWKTIAYLLGGGAKVNAQIPPIPNGKDLDPKLVGMTSLMLAVDEHDDQAFFFLLQGGADPGLKNAAGKTVADLLAEHIRKNTEKEDMGKDLREMQRALTDTVWGKKKSKAVVEEYLERSVDDHNLLVATALLNMGADPNMYDDDKPLLLQAVNDGGFPMVKLLIDHGATPNAVDDTGISPFLEAVGGKHASEEMARYMLSHGANPHYVPPGAPFTLLHALTMRGAAGLIPDMVAAGVDVNARLNENGNTALHLAADKGQFEAFKALIAAGANPSLRNKNDETALDLVPPKDRSQYNATLR